MFDQATIGLMRGGLQLTRNTIFAAAKLLALPVRRSFCTTSSVSAWSPPG